MRSRLWVLLALSLIVGFAPAPFPRTRRGNPDEDDLRRMQGTWVVTKYEHERKDALTPLKREMRLEFHGHRSLCWVGGDRTEWTIELSATSAPRAITSTQGKGEKGGAVLKGIYRFEGDKLIICESQGKERPTQFDSTGGSWLMELKRR